MPFKFQPTIVVNIRRNAYDVYIGRPGPFGNPFAVNTGCGWCCEFHSERRQTIPCFDAYFHQRLRIEPKFVELVRKLRGKKLGCYCAPAPCHGDVIAQWLNCEACGGTGLVQLSRNETGLCTQCTPRSK